MSLIYLASPYSHPDPRVREQRFEAVVRASVRLMVETGAIVYSPIAASHPIAKASGGSVRGDWRAWAELDRAIIAACSSVYVLALPGWEASEGVEEEIGIAHDLDIPVLMLAPEEREIIAADAAYDMLPISVETFEDVPP